MKFKINNIKVITVLGAIMMTTSCKDSFFDINTNPNNPTDPLVKASYVLPMVLKQTATRMGTQYSFAASWTGYWSRGSDFGQSIPLENYAITPSFEQGQWANSTTSWYDVIMDADVVEKKGGQAKEEFYVAVAKVMKAIGFMYLVDMYNNVPYSDALKGDASIAPSYDKGVDIYKDLLVQLDAARKIFKTSGLPVTDEMKNADVLFAGNLTKWRKLTNTLTLKLLIHESELNKTPTAEIAKITADGAGFLGTGETANVNLTFANNKNQVNPVYSTYVADESGILTDGFNRVSNYLLNKYKNNDDIRYQYLFLPANDPLDPDDPWAGTDFGAASASGTTSANQSIVIGEGILSDGTKPLWLFTSVESLFLQAEAMQRGWVSGDPKVGYENAVKESFKWLGVENAASVSSTYLLSNFANWSKATNKIELIINQKYLALPGINNFEAWVDYRRLGFPKDVPLSKNQSAGNRKIPLRLLYPQNEYSYNNANVLAQGDINPQTSKIFWDIN